MVSLYNYDNLSEDEIKELWNHLDNPVSRTKLVISQLELIDDILLKKYSFFDFDQEDLFQMGTIGLMKAIDTYSYAKDKDFKSYAEMFIEYEILKHIKSLGRYDIRRPLEDENEMDESQMHYFYDDDENVEEKIMKIAEIDVIKKAISKLSPDQRKVFELYYGIEDGKSHTINEIAGLTSTTKQNISSKLKAITLKISKSIKYNNLFEDYNNESKKVKNITIKNDSLYEYFFSYKKEEIDYVLSILTASEYKLLRKCYGRFFEGPRIFEGKYERINVYRIISKMKDLLQKTTGKYYSYDLYHVFGKNYSVQEIEKAINELPNAYIELIEDNNVYIFGQELLNELYINNKNKRFDFIVNMLNNILKSNKKDTMTIYDRFKDYSKEEIDEVVNHMSFDMKALYDHVYGATNSGINASLIKSINRKLYPYILKQLKLNRNIDEQINQLQSSLLEQYGPMDIMSYANVLSREEKRVFEVMFLERDNIYRISEYDLKHKYYDILINIKTRIKHSYKPTADRYYFKQSIVQSIKNKTNGKYTEREIVSAINMLIDTDILFLKECFGDDFKTPTGRYLTKEEKIKGINLNNKITNILKNGYNKKSLYEEFSDYTIEQIDKLVSTLNEEEKALLNKIFKGDFSRTPRIQLKGNESVLYKRIKTKLKTALDNYDNKKFSLYDYFEEYTKEEIDEAILKLPQEDIELLKVKYGEDLNSFPNRIDHNLNNRIITIREKIIRRLNDKDSNKYSQPVQNIYNYFGNLNSKIVDILIEHLPIDDQMVIDDYKNNRIKYDSKEYQRFYNIITKLKRRIKYANLLSFDEIEFLEDEDLDFTQEDYEWLRKAILTEEFEGFKNRFTTTELCIISTKLGFGKRKSLSNERICKLFGVSESYVLEVLRKFLSQCKSDMVDLNLDNNILSRKKKNN